MNKEAMVYLHTRITPTNKAYVLRACQAVGKNLSDFTRDCVMAEADYILGHAGEAKIQLDPMHRIEVHEN
jgi:uncharacterized protein (DUF1778 family)